MTKFKPFLLFYVDYKYNFIVSNVNYEFILFFKFIQKIVLNFVATWIIKIN